MLPTPDTSHVSYKHVYEPAEDSFLFLDTLSSPSETAFLSSRFSVQTTPFSSTSSPSCTVGAACTPNSGKGTIATSLTTPDRAASTSNPTSPQVSISSPPLILEVGSGSGVVLAFLTAHAKTIFGTSSVLTAAIDANRFACAATGATVAKAVASASGGTSSSAPTSGPEPGPGLGVEPKQPRGLGLFLDALQADLGGPLRSGTVDVLVFNPPYVPTPELPALPMWGGGGENGSVGPGAGRDSTAAAAAAAAWTTTTTTTTTTFEEESHLLALSYAGGRDGMETTDRLIDGLPNLLSARGCAYLLLCAQNRPEEVKTRIRGFGEAWRVETVGTSGRQAGWEMLQIIRIWRAGTS